MKIGAVISTALQKLLEKKSVNVDYVEVNGEDNLALLRGVLTLRPVLLHDISNDFWLTYADPFDEATMSKARAMIELARPPWHSTGIGSSAEPQGHTTDFWRGAPESALQPREVCLANIVRNGRQLVGWLGIPLLLENYNYHLTNAYEYVCEPETFTRLIEDIGCGVLLDLAHAQISAFNMGWSDPQAYLSALPLAKVREIHINHPFNDNGRQLLDKHLPIRPGDLDLLRWTLDRAPNVEAITLEADASSGEEVIEQVVMLRGAVG